LFARALGPGFFFSFFCMSCLTSLPPPSMRSPLHTPIFFFLSCIHTLLYCTIMLLMPLMLILLSSRVIDARRQVFERCAYHHLTFLLTIFTGNYRYSRLPAGTPDARVHAGTRATRGCGISACGYTLDAVPVRMQVRFFWSRVTRVTSAGILTDALVNSPNPHARFFKVGDARNGLG
jgi:hypothetical protein